MKKIILQHGDVIVESVNCIPEEAKCIRLDKGARGLIIERGEGVHVHELQSNDYNELCDLIDCYELNGEMYFRVKKSNIKITHEEHGTQIIEPGIYRKNIEQVFDYEKMESTRVGD